MEHLENILSHGMVQRLGWMLVHFVWQASMVALLLAILLKLLHKYSASLRYIVACMALVIMVLLPAITMNLIPVAESYSPIETTPEPASMAIVSTPAELEIPANIETPVIEAEIPVQSIVASVEIPFSQRITKVLEPTLPYVVMAWFAGVFGLSLWYLGGWTQLQRLRQKMVKPVDESLQSKLKELAGVLGVNRAVQLVESALVQTPTVVGWLKPVILLPASVLTGFSAEQIDAILAHELAHIKRCDYLVNMLQTAVEILGFYHPAVWWISKKIRIERENCCDDIAVKISGDRIGYAKTLALFDGIRVGQPELAVAASGGSLFERICRLLGKDTANEAKPSWLSSVVVMLLIVALLIPTALAMTNSSEKSPAVQVEGEGMRVYKLDKRVSDFPPTADFSTPEAAYATIMRDYMATGASGAEWSKISANKELNDPGRTVKPKMKEKYLNARIVEVRIYKDRMARVFAEMKEDGKTGYDQYSLILHDGQWLNSGQDGLAPTLKAARNTFAIKCARLYRKNLKKLGESVAARWNRPPISDHEEYLKPYVDFLKKEGTEPHAFMMKAFKKYELVTMGEVHHRPDYWAFNTELVRDPAFAESVGTIYLELPLNHQENIDRFLSQATCEKEIVIDMLRDMMEFGWICQPTLDFFVAVWQVNQKLPSNKKLRIRLVDMERPWEKIQERKDLQQYRVDRDLFMAENILKDRQTRQGKQRHGFFIAGMMHTMAGFYYADQATRRGSAGWNLKQVLGNQLFSVFQHVPVSTNKGRVSGRLALGLIDAAFARLGDRPIAFILQKGPFGKLPFDGMPDADVYGNFCDGYDAYLYLVPLENELRSPPIEGFYSKEFTSEIDRRNQLMYGKPLHESIATSEGMTASRASFCGQPRSWTRSLGPENAWHHGEQWQTIIEKERLTNVRREELTAELDKIYKGIREIGSEIDLGALERKFAFNYMTMMHQDVMYRWWCDVTKEHPLESVEYGKLSRNKEGLPQIEVTTTLQGGITFSKVFSFKYDALRDSWPAQYGLDLHLDKKWKDLPKAKR
jgi:beta-lactamase regulating signal transducer with metallopeptidase domain